MPDNARVKLTIGQRADAGLTFVKRGVSIVPLDVRSVPGTPTGEAVLFANSTTDADHIVRVTPAGADSLVQVRSTASPEQFRYRVDLPAGGSLRLLPAGDIAVIVGGRRVGTIVKPTAWDVDQRSVPVTSTLRGTTLTLDVAHRGRDVRYPLMVDPNYVDLFQYGWHDGGPNNATNAFWAFRTNDASKMAGFFGNYGQGVLGQTNGLYALTLGNQILNAGQYAYWTFTAPGTTSVLQAEWTHISHIEAHAIGPPPCLDYGLIHDTTAWRTHDLECANFTPAYRLSCWDCDDLDGFSYDPTVKGAQFGSGTYANTIATVSDYVGEVTIYLADPDDRPSP